MAKPIWSTIWSSLSGPSDIEEPTNVKQNNGWESGEKPPHKSFNWFWNKICNTFKILNDQGILEWDIATSYPANAIVYHLGAIYLSNSGSNVGNEPSATSIYWQFIRLTNVSISTTPPVNGRVGNLWVNPTNGSLYYCTVSAPTNTWVALTNGASNAVPKTTATGSANALVATFATAFTSLADIKLVVIKTAFANTSAIPTLDIDGLGPKEIVKDAGVAVEAGEIDGSVLITYDPIYGKYVLLNPSIKNKISIYESAYLEYKGSSGFGDSGVVKVYDFTNPSGKPIKHFEFYAKCKFSDGGYSPGMIIPLGSFGMAGTAAGMYGYGCFQLNATTMRMVVDSNHGLATHDAAGTGYFKFRNFDYWDIQCRFFC